MLDYHEYLIFHKNPPFYREEAETRSLFIIRICPTLLFWISTRRDLFIVVIPFRLMYSHLCPTPVGRTRRQNETGLFRFFSHPNRHQRIIQVRGYIAFRWPRCVEV